MIMQLKFKSCGLQRAVGYLAFAVLCGSAAVACSGTINTPSEENPPRQAGNDDDEDPEPVAQAGAGNTNTGNDDDDDDDAVVPPPGDDDEEDPPADPPPGDDDEEDPPADPPPSGDLSFEADVWPIFNGQCGGCHVTQGLGQQNIGSDDIPTALQDARDFEAEVIAELEEGSMPLGCGAPPGGGGLCVSEEDFATIEAWYAAGAPE
jgi:hypothetical protein